MGSRGRPLIIVVALLLGDAVTTLIIAITGTKWLL